MDTDQSTHKLLEHFDRPKRVISPDFDWDESDCGAAEFDPRVAVDSKFMRCSRRDRWVPSQPLDSSPQLPAATIEPPVATIGVWCVLQWAAAVVILAVVANVLYGFAQRLGTQRSLQLAARAGAIEAVLPRASYHSVRDTIGRRLAGISELESWELTLLQNDAHVFRQIAENERDLFIVTVTARMSSTVPAWLQWLPGVGEPSTITVQAEKGRPGRHLTPRTQVSATW
jgi:hypothetical protein